MWRRAEGLNKGRYYFHLARSTVQVLITSVSFTELSSKSKGSIGETLKKGNHESNHFRSPHLPDIDSCRPSYQN